MKQTLILLVVTLMFSCGDAEKKELSKQKQDTLIIKDNPLPVIIIDKSVKDKIDQFRTPIRDVAYYFLTHPDNIKIDYYVFECDKYEFWISGGYNYFKLYSPMQMELKSNEKEYFWSMYIHHKTNYRLFKYEEKYEIKTK